MQLFETGLEVDLKMQNANNMSEVIKWCNENVGFATIILAVLTLLFSIIAIIVSIRTANLPFKKMVKIEAGRYSSTDGDTGLHVTAINCGNMDFTIISMGFVTKENKLMVNLHSNNRYPARLKNGEQISEYFTDKAQEIQSLESNYIVYAYVKDSEGKIYKKKMKCK